MPSENTVHIAIELSFSSWLVAARLAGAKKSRLHRIEGGDTGALLALIAELRSRALTQLGGAAEVACCFEAGRDGFWLHRLLTAQGILVYVLEPTSILVNRRSRRAKTDRLDAEGMLRVLAAWLGGDRQVCSMVRVPTPEEEDGKRPHRERERLVQEKLRIENRIEALLFTQGIRARPSLRSWERELTELRTGDGRTLPPLLRAELDRLRRRLVLILELIRELEAERAAALAAAPDEAMAQKITSLQRVRGIGANYHRYESAYLFGAICPARGTGAALAMPYADSEAMQLHLVEISSRVRRGAHAVLLLDRAGWHTTGRLVVPKNITLVFLPSRAPELNPVENIWQYLRQNWLSNRVFETYEAIIEAACDAWRSLLAEPTTITSIGHRGWAHVGQK